MAYLHRARRGSIAEFQALNRLYANGELLLEEQGDGTFKLKAADGVRTYNNLPYVTGSGGGGNSFTTITVPAQASVVADSSVDTLTLVGENGISVVTSASTDTITWSPVYGSSANTICQGNDSRIGAGSGGGLSFSNIAVSGQSTVVADATDDTLTLAGDGISIVTNASTDTITLSPTYGSAVNTVCQGNDTRLTNARTPTSHASSHASAGADSVKLDALAVPDDVTTLNSTTTRHGLLPKLNNDPLSFLNGQGTWIVPGGDLNIRDFGAPMNGTDSDATAITAALAVANASSGGVVRIPRGANTYINSVVTIPPNCVLDGHKGALGIISANISGLRPLLTIGPSGKLVLGNASCVRNLTILRAGITWNGASSTLSQFVGTAIEIADSTSDPVVEDCSIFGFAYGIRSVSGATNVSRVRLSRINMDNLTCVYLENSWDVTYINEIHCWPFITVAATPETNGAHIKRPGVGIEIVGVHDWTKVTNCFTFGYQRGFRINGGDSVTLLSCSSDNAPAPAGGAIGFLIDGDAYECKLIGCQSAANNIGIYSNTTATNGSLIVIGATIWESQDHAIVNERGTLIASGCALRNTSGSGNGVVTVSTSTETRISDSQLRGFAIGVANASSSTRMFHNGIDFTGTTTLVVTPFVPSIASAANLVVDGESTFFTVTGITTISSIAHVAAYAGRTLRLKFTGALTVLDASPLFLAGNFVTSADDMITLTSDGTNWYENSRSAN